MNESIFRSTIPIIVNSFNQPTYLLRMVARLVSQQFRNIWVIDQASTTSETRRALKLLETSSCCRIYYLQGNNGPHWFFGSELYKLAGDLFVYTDADLDLSEHLPSNFLTRLIQLTEKYQVGKAGCALALDDSHLFVDRVTSVRGQNFSIKQWEERFYRDLVEPDVYRAIIDTTFALYNKNLFEHDNFLKAVRVSGAWTARHLPWYRDKRVPLDEWDAYEKSTKHSHWFNAARAEEG